MVLPATGLQRGLMGWEVSLAQNKQTLGGPEISPGGGGGLETVLEAEGTTRKEVGSLELTQLIALWSCPGSSFHQGVGRA